MCGTTSSTTNAPNPAAAANYADVTARAKGVADTPYQPYGGELVAGLNGGQNQAIGELQSAYGTANPYFNSASGYLGNANQGLGGVQNYLQAGSQSVGNAQGYAGQAAGLANPNANQQYMNPYTNSVINATMAQAQQQDAIQRQGLASNAIGQGAYGGDRAGVAQAALAGQQDLANNQTIAGLNSANYAQANAARVADAGVYGNLANSANQSAGLYGTLGQTQAQTASAQGQLAGLSGYIGSAAQQANISGASAGLQASTLQQQNAQQQDQAAYGQFQNQISYPFQTTNWLSNIVQGIGNQQGGIKTDQGSALSGIAGAATTGLGILGATGGFNSTNPVTGAATQGWLGKAFGFADGGRVSRARGGGLAGGRMHYMDGGDTGLVDPNAPVGVQPPSGINFAPSGLMGGGGFNPTAPAAAFAPGSQQRMSNGSVPRVGMPVLGADPAAETPPPAAGLAAASGAGGGLAGGAPASQGVVGGPEMNKWLAITAAGLGMMGGTSASAGVNIGKGGLAGLQEYTQLQNMDRQNAMQQAELGLKRGTLGVDQQRAEQDAERLHQQADQFKQTFALDQQKTNAGLVSMRPGIDQQGNRGFYVTDMRDPGHPKISFQNGIPGSGAPADGSSAPPPGMPTGAPISDPSAPVPASAGSGSGAVPSPSGVPSPQAAAVPAQSANPADVLAWHGATSVGRGWAPETQPDFDMAQPDAQKQQIEMGGKDVEKERDAGARAQAGNIQLSEMNDAIDKLPKTGIAAPGPWGKERANVIKAANGVATTLGMNPVFSEESSANLQALQKDTFRLGTQMMANTNGGREAGFILKSSVGATPGIENTYLGFKRVAAGIQMQNQYLMDRAQFMDDYYAKFHHLQGAAARFNQVSPPEMYAAKAIAMSSIPPQPPTVPAGSQYSLSLGKWRDPQGNIYDARGNKAQ